MNRIQIVAILLNIFLAGMIVELIRRGRLKEKYSLLWLFAIGVMMFLSFWQGFLDIVSKWVGIYYSPSFLFLVAFVFLILISLHFSVVISGLTEKNKKLAQEMGLLKNIIDKLQQK